MPKRNVRRVKNPPPRKPLFKTSGSDGDARFCPYDSVLVLRAPGVDREPGLFRHALRGAAEYFAAFRALARLDGGLQRPIIFLPALAHLAAVVPCRIRGKVPLEKLNLIALAGHFPPFQFLRPIQVA